MKKIKTAMPAFFLISVLGGCVNETTEQETTLTISAAASLQTALGAIKEQYEDLNPEVEIVYNFGSSGTLQQQIAQGAPVDLFFSAGEAPFQKLLTDGLIEEKQRTNLLSNELVVIVPKENDLEIQALEDLIKARTIAIGTPESVPAGQYGVEALTKLQLWDALQTKAVYAKDVRQVLTYTASANVDVGIVYKTDVLTSDNVTVIATIPAQSHAPIIYPVGIVKDRPHTEEVQQFYDFLLSADAMEQFENYGFKGVE